MTELLPVVETGGEKDDWRDAMALSGGGKEACRSGCPLEIAESADGLRLFALSEPPVLSEGALGRLRGLLSGIG